MRFRKDPTSHQIRMSRRDKCNWIPALPVLGHLARVPNVYLYVQGRTLFRDNPIGGLKSGKNIGSYGAKQ